jgi:hypothetical protein
MYMTEELQKKWNPVLEHPELEAIKDPYKRAVTALVLENQQQAMSQDAQVLNETAYGTGGPTNVTGSGISNFDPILISLVRRSLPNLIAYDVAGVQPMTGPTGLIFAMRVIQTKLVLRHSSTKPTQYSLVLHLVLIPTVSVAQQHLIMISQQTL